MQGGQEWEWKERMLSEEAGSWGDITFLFLDWVAPWPQLEGTPGCSTRKMSLLDFIMYETANQTYLLIYSRSFPLTLTPAVSVLPHFQGKYHTFYSAALIHPPKCMLYKSGFTYKACGEIIKYDPFTKQCIQFELTKYQFGPHPLIFWSLEPILDDSEQEAGSTLDRLPINHKERRQHLG